MLVLENKPGRAGARNDFWHSDISFAAKPPQASILYALRVTEGVGDTLFANMYAAYDRLPAGMKARLEGVSAFHSSEKLAERARQAAGSDARPDRLDSAAGAASGHSPAPGNRAAPRSM